MLLFVAEGAGHAAAAARDDVDNGAGQEAEGGSGLVDADQSFLVAVAVEPYFNGVVTEGGGRDAAGGDLAHYELVEKEAVGREGLGHRPHFRWHEIRILVAEAEDARRLDADEGGVGGDDVGEEADIADGEAAGKLQTAL